MNNDKFPKTNVRPLLIYLSHFLINSSSSFVVFNEIFKHLTGIVTQKIAEIDFFFFRSSKNNCLLMYEY